MGTPLLLITAAVKILFLAIMLIYLAVLRSGAQSIIINRNTRYNNGSDNIRKYNSSILQNIKSSRRSTRLILYITKF